MTRSKKKSKVTQVTCVICGDSTPGATLRPCGHKEMCFPCVIKTMQSGCPLCRQGIDEVVVLPEGKKYAFHDLVFHKQIEKGNSQKSHQIVVVGFANSGKELFAEAMKKNFPLVGQCRNPPQPGFESRFSPNMNVVGTESRITVIPCSDPDMNVNDEVAHLEPEMVVICASLNGPNLMHNFRLWDRAIPFARYTAVVWVAMPDNLERFCNSYSWNGTQGFIAAIPRISWFNWDLLNLPEPVNHPIGETGLNGEITALVKSNITRTALKMRELVAIRRKDVIYLTGPEGGLLFCMS